MPTMRLGTAMAIRGVTLEGEISEFARNAGLRR
jgi:hypothetical protein